MEEKINVSEVLSDDVILSKIYIIRKVKVMLDRDLAELYGVETKYLKRQVRRNIIRFPEDFMFELTDKELANWRSQFVTSNMDKMGLRHLPYAFTEDGIAHLSNPIPFNIAMYLGLLCRFLKCIEKLISAVWFAV